jgi:hypothetical protein
VPKSGAEGGEPAEFHVRRTEHPGGERRPRIEDRPARDLAGNGCWVLHEAQRRHRRHDIELTGPEGQRFGPGHLKRDFGIASPCPSSRGLDHRGGGVDSRHGRAAAGEFQSQLAVATADIEDLAAADIAGELEDHAALSSPCSNVRALP